jgi:alkylated DNA repair protein (DNA oxidative demethylase)
MSSLFDNAPSTKTIEKLGEAAVLLRNFAAEDAALLIEEISRITRNAPFRKLETRGGYQMSVAMTNCGRVGWVSDRTGYRYDPADPQTGKPWPAMPEAFQKLAMLAAAEAGFSGYDPDACLINHYIAGSRLGLHQDRDENDPWAPIVSVSLGVPAIFLWGGKRRSDPIRRLIVESGDVVVWGGPARFTYHGVAPLKPGWHRLTGTDRYNLTFRRVF